MPWHPEGAQKATQQLRAWCEKQRRIPLLFGVERADLAALPGWKIRELGRQPIFVAGSSHAPQIGGVEQPPRGREMRRQARRALSKRANWREVSAGEVAEHQASGALRALWQTRWWRQPLAEFSFLVGLHLFAGQQDRRYFLLEVPREDCPCGLAILVRSDRGWLLEHQIVGAQAPNGSGELLVSQLLSRDLHPGQLLSLGITPLYRALVGDVCDQDYPAILSFLPRPVRAALLSAWEPLYGFRRLERFRSKLEPDRWEPVYWAHSTGSPAMALGAVLSVFAGGSLGSFAVLTLKKFAGKLAQTVSRRRLEQINRFFLVSLCVWIPILWNLDGELLYGTAVAPQMWALYDVLLVLGFAWHGRSLAQFGHRFQTSSAVMLGLVSADAGLSLLWSCLLHDLASMGLMLSLFVLLLSAAPLAASLFLLLCVAYPTDFLRHGGSKGELENP